MAARLLYRDPQGQDVSVTVRDNEPTYVGRAAECAARTDDARVSRKNCKLSFVGGRYIVEDLGSSSGTFVNESRIERLALTHGDVIRCGRFQVRFVVESGTDLERWLERLDPTEAKFLRDIAERPGVAEVRLVYADWLEERGDPSRAELLRLQLTLSGLAATDERLPPLAQRLQQLMPATEVAWRTFIAQAPLENCAVTFVIKCPLKWEQLQPTASPDVRHCDACQKHVHYCTTAEEVRRHAWSGGCVAVDVVVPRRPGDLTPPPPMRTAGVPMPR